MSSKCNASKINTKQKTLFESWKSSNDASADACKRATNLKEPCIVDLCDEDDLGDDDLLNVAIAIEVGDGNNADSNGRDRNENKDPFHGSDFVSADGFDIFSGDLWIYPTNYPVRDYQFSIVKAAIFKNTLVALPTGLGKTFIAAVVLYNFYRWYPQGKVVFMAPTKPLVSQQIEACYKVMGIPMEDQIQITGATMAAARRSEIWASKRVFFATPQVISNDLAKGVCPANAIKCLVIDEAHKALGNHAYCQVVQQLLSSTSNFRVLALSATPGSDLKTVQQVIKNLLISHIEIRADDAIDIKQYTHTRCVEKVVVKLTKQILDLRERYFTVIQMFISNLVNNRALYNKDVRHLSKYALLMARDQFRKDPPSGLARQLIGTLEGTFAISISLYHGLELLLQHGMKSFFIFLKGIMDGSKGSVRSKTILYENTAFRSVYEELTECFGAKPDSVVLCTQAGGTQHAIKKPVANPDHARPYTYSHPKMEKLEQIVVQHFQDVAGSSAASQATRVMIFCQYRDIVREITELLQRHRPHVRPMQFVGHAPSTNPNNDEKTGAKPNRRFTQKDQLLVVNKFRSGDYNTLVSTCVGEEGLDIGDVDLIVCYDSHKSPIRLVQRMGRTGRKRKGKIVMLVTEGKEERDYNSSLASRRSIHKAIMGAGKSLQYYPYSPAMIPSGLRPTCHKMFMTVPEKPGAVTGKSKTKIKEKKSTTPDVAIMFKKSAQYLCLSDEQRDIWKNKFMLSDNERSMAKALPPQDNMGRCLYIEKELWGDKCGKRNSKFLSLTEWLPWQSRLQQTKLVEHSAKSKMLSEVLQFCDTLREKGSTQCGYKSNVPSRQLIFGQEKSSNKKTTASKPNKRKTRKPLIVLSDDDEDYLLPDDFHDTPHFGPQASETIATNEVMPSRANATESYVQLSQTRKQFNSKAATVTSNFSETSVHLKPNRFHSKFDSKDSTISANLTPVAISPEHEIDSCSEPVKVSKALHDVNISLPQGSICLDSISFECLEDDKEKPTMKKNATRKPVCFTLWDSDEDKSPKNDLSNAEYTVLRPAKDGCPFGFTNDDMEDETTLLSLLEDEIVENVESCAKQLTQSKTEIKCKKLDQNTIDTILQSKNVQPETAVISTSSNNASKSCVNDLHFTTNKSLPSTSYSCHLTKPLCNSKVDSFDVSADMFAPQFDLDFDLGFDDLESKANDPLDHKKFVVPAKPDSTIQPVAASENKNSKSNCKLFNLGQSNEVACREKVFKNQDNSNTNVSTPLSPVSMNSFNLSQNKRLENQKLFSELNFSGAHAVPCAKVKPQLQNMEPQNESCSIIVSSPLQTKNKMELKKEKSRKRTSFLTNPVTDDDDDFQTTDETSNFKKCRFFNSFTGKNPSLFPKTDFSLPSDEEWSSDPEIPFKDNSSASEAVFDENEDKSPLLSLAAKKKHKTTSYSTPHSKPPFVRTLISEAKHSTPKSETPRKDSKRESDFSDDSIVRRRPKLQKKRRLARNMFVCDEADVSVDGASMSSDENEEEENDEEMRDFVNDATQLTTNEQLLGLNEREIYLRSLNNVSTQKRAPTEMLAGKYKLAYGFGEDIDVFSQVPDKDVSDYANDSFCVQNDEVEEVSDLGEITLLDSSSIVDATCRPKTRAQAKLKKVLSDPGKTKPKKRLVIFDEEEAESSVEIQKDQSNCNDRRFDRASACVLLDLRLIQSGAKPMTLNTVASLLDVQHPREQAAFTTGVPGQPSIRRLADTPPTPARYCEVCGASLTTMGWLCKACIAVMKKSELVNENQTTNVPSTSREEKSKHKLDEKGKQKIDHSFLSGGKLKHSNQVSIRLTLSKEERLRRSKLRHKELREKLKSKRSSLDSNEDREKLTIFVDKQELDKAQEMAQVLRITHNVDVQAVSLQCCSLVLSRRCAVIRKTVYDVTNHTKQEELRILVKKAVQYYSKIIILVEKNKGNKGGVSTNKSRSFSTNACNFMSTLSTTTASELEVHHSDGQTNSAHLLHMLALRELSFGQSISEDALRCSNDETLRPLMNIYLSLPGVSYVHALYMCLRFDSLNTLVKSSLETLTQEIHLSVDTAKNLLSLFGKKFQAPATSL